jgi:hypothetical protein
MRSNVPFNSTLRKKGIIQPLLSAVVGISALSINISDVSAMGSLMSGSAITQAVLQSAATPVAVVRRGAVARRTTVVGPHGGAASRTVVRRGAVVRPGVVRPGAWVRPSWYRWAPGGAIAAGAALGFVTAATAVAWAGAPPASGYCWFYTDASRQQGFWDVCPR